MGPAVRWLKDVAAQGVCLMILLWPVDRWLLHLSAPVCLAIGGAVGLANGVLLFRNGLPE
jgi:ribose/xylose/arabinose/galactoside ABC-type transport system permease subunit